MIVTLENFPESIFYWSETEVNKLNGDVNLISEVAGKEKKEKEKLNVIISPVRSAQTVETLIEASWDLCNSFIRVNKEESKTVRVATWKNHIKETWVSYNTRYQRQPK